ncbi:MAG: hypothetical protein SV775_08740 [Thermodesulfobacteriota bacterium]|nr:hypothetical protein [Thermodesulfobacteriota bacterium]
MKLPRKLGIAITMIIPGFVFGGLVWHLFRSWCSVLALEAVVVLLYYFIISGRLSAILHKT